MRPRTYRPRLEPLDDRVLPSFSPAVDYPVGGNNYANYAMTNADFDGDGRLDLVVASGGYGVSVLLGKGDGTFQRAVDSPTGGLWDAIVAADFNEDHRPDLASTSAVLLGNGDGTFGAPSSLGATWSGIAAGDLNGDGHIDLVGAVPGSVDGADGWISAIYPGFIHVRLGNGDGTFRDGTFATAGVDSRTVVLADLNADGRLDVVADDFGLSGFGYPTSPGLMYVYLGSGDGSLRPGVAYGLPDSGMGIAVADFDSDGILDLATRFGIMAGNGDGSFGPVRTNHNLYLGTSTADLNADGHADLFGFAGPDWPNFDRHVYVQVGRGDGTFEPAKNYRVAPTSISATVADLNGDGFPDLATANTSNTASVLMNDANWPPPDAPWVTVRSDTIAEGNTGTRTMTFIVSLSAPYDRPVTVTYATSSPPSNNAATAGVDYQATSGTLTFAPGETTKAVAVLVYGDRLAEPDELFAVNLTGAVNANISGGRATGAIFDDEPRIRMSEVTQAEGNAGIRIAGFVVTLSTISDQPVTVAYAAADGTATAGSDYQPASGTLVIPAGQTTRTITVRVIGDRVPEPDETFAVNLSGATNGLILDAQATGTIRDDEPRIRISDGSKVEGRNGRTTRFTFTLTLSAAYDQPVTVLFHTTNGTAIAGEDYRVRLGTLTFLPGQTRKTITVVVKGDARRESDETFFVDLTGISDYVRFDKGRSIGTILNDD